MHLRMGILLLLDGMFYIYLLIPSGLNVSFHANVSLLIFCLDDISIQVSGVLKFPTIILMFSIAPFMSVNICFIYLGAPMLAT